MQMLRTVGEILHGRAGGELIASNVLQALIAFGANIVLVRYIAPESFGAFALLLAGAGLIFGVCSLRLSTLILRLSDEEVGAETKALFFSLMTIEAVVGFAICLIWLLLSDANFVLGFMVVLSLTVHHWVRQNKAFFERHMRYKSLARAEFASSCVAHCVAVVLVIIGFDFLALYIREVLLAALSALFLMLVGGLTWVAPKNMSVEGSRTVLRDARAIWVEGLLESSFGRVITLGIGAFGTLQAVGYFFQAQRLAVVPHQILAPLASRMAMIWFGGGKGKNKTEGRRGLVFTLGPMLLVASVLTFFLAPPIVTFVFGETWTDAGNYLVLLAVYILFNTLFEINRGYCLTNYRMRVLLMARALQYASLFGIFAFTAFYIGMGAGPGACLAISGAFAVGFLYSEWVLRRREAQGLSASS